MADSTRRSLILLLLGAAGRLAWAQGAGGTTAPSSPGDVPRMDPIELKPLVDKGQAVLVDVRNQQAWDDGHAEGAIHVPVDQVEARARELPKDKLIAAYCT